MAADSGALQPADIETCHGAHVLRVRLVALLEESGEPPTDATRIVEMLRLWEPGVPFQKPMGIP